ncbi:2974_t:CDS:2, partial [Racocetra persica]
RTEVQTCNLLAGKSYQITESLEIWLEPSLCLCFREQKQRAKWEDIPYIITTPHQRLIYGISLSSSVVLMINYLRVILRDLTRKSSKRKVLCYRPAISGFVDENEKYVEIGHIDLCLACIAREFEIVK